MLTITAATPDAVHAVLRNGISGVEDDEVLKPGSYRAIHHRYAVNIEKGLACAEIRYTRCGDEHCAGCDDIIVVNADTGELTCEPCRGETN